MLLTCPAPSLLAVLQLEVEIEALRAQNCMYQRVLAVRDAMLQTFTSMQPPEVQAASLQQAGAAPAQPQQQGQTVPLPQLPAPEAAGGLAHALSELPSDGELEAAEQSAASAEVQAAEEAAQEPQAGTHEGAAVASSGADGLQGSSSGLAVSEAGAAVGSAPQSLLGEAHRSGVASSLDGSALQEVEEVPPPSNKALLARIQSWAGPEDLVRGGWAGCGQ